MSSLLLARRGLRTVKSERWVWLAALALGAGLLGAGAPSSRRCRSTPLPERSGAELLLQLPVARERPARRAHRSSGHGAAMYRGRHRPRARLRNSRTRSSPRRCSEFLLCWRLLALASLVGHRRVARPPAQGPWSAPRARQVVRGASVPTRRGFGPSRCSGCSACSTTQVRWFIGSPSRRNPRFCPLPAGRAVHCTLRGSRSVPCSWGEGIAARGGAPEFITTIKLTLWPVTLFVLGWLAFAPGPMVAARGWRRFAGFTGVALAHVRRDRVGAGAASRRVLAVGAYVLIEHNGRYGGRYGARSRPGVGIVSAVVGRVRGPAWRAFALQAYTTLPVFGGVLLWALESWRRRGAGVDQPARTAATGFIAALLLLFLMFLKHPYQGKYLMPASLLILLYAAVQVEAGRLPPLRWLRPLCLILGLIALNAVLSQKLLYDYTIPRDERIRAHIDAWLAKVPHDALIFSSRLPHPIPAYRESAPPPLLPDFHAAVPRPRGADGYVLARFSACRRGGTAGAARRAACHRLPQCIPPPTRAGGWSIPSRGMNFMFTPRRQVRQVPMVLPRMDVNNREFGPVVREYPQFMSPSLP